MDPEFVSKIKERFREADTSGDGVIDTDEFKETFRQMGEWPDEELDLLISRVDQSGDGTIDYVEFIDWIAGAQDIGEAKDGEDRLCMLGAKDMVDGEALLERFRSADTSGDGVIDRDELGALFREISDDWFSDEDLDMMFSQVDTSGSGVIDYREFVTWIMCAEQIEKDGGVNGDNEAELVCMDGAMQILDSGAACEDEECWSEEWSDWEERDEDWGDDSEYCEEEEDFGFFEEGEEGGEGGEEGEAVADDDDGGFRDLAFPPSQKSLGKPKGDTASGEEYCGAHVSGWKRLPRICGEESGLFKRIRANDVEQGQLGNCWFLAACASVARHPAWVRKMFCGVEELSQDGSYEVRLYHPGKRGFVHIKVDDFVPENEGQLSFCQPTNDSEVWPCLMEKAFAKLCGSYSGTEAGHAVWGMGYLCGEGAEFWTRRDEEDRSKWIRSKLVWKGGDSNTICRQAEEGEGDPEGFEPRQDPKTGEWDHELSRVWDALQAYGKKKYAMCAGVWGGKDEKGDMQGIVAGHAYSLITAQRVTSKGHALRMVQLRNPHGAGEWTGPWGDSSEKWKEHPVVADVLAHVEKEDGCFWMSFKDFVKYFDSWSVMKKDLS